jgi:hypothetical protein
MDIINIFKSIRDIPYKIPLTLTDKSIDCDKKHRELYRLLKKEGIKARFRICVFLWSDLNIPKYILDIPHTDRCEHLYLEAFLNEQWIILDATWDIGLKNILNVNFWDGKSNTDIAVKPIEILEPQKNTKLIHCQTRENFEKDIKDSGKFYKELNNWLEKERVKIFE